MYKVYFYQHFNLGKIASSDLDSKTYEKKADLVQCLPLYSLLLALNRTTVDYFSLDVEGNELDVLRTIPWDKVNIRVSQANLEIDLLNTVKV